MAHVIMPVTVIGGRNMIVGEAFIAVRPDATGFGPAAEKGVLGTVTGIAKKAAAILGGAFVAQKGFDFLKDSVAAARESNAVAAQTAAAIKSTGGAANVTAKEVSNLADAIARKTGVDDEQIAKASNLLLTFTGIRNEAGKNNDIFNQATKIAVDMGKALGTDAAGSAIQLGKALNDPVKGITALTRVGVTFSDVQKKQIENFVEAGRTADAQKVILAELTKEFGGSAEAQATASDKLKVTLGNLQEEIGNNLVPIIDKVAGFLAEKLPGAIDSAKTAFANLLADTQPVRDYIANTLAPALLDAGERLLPVIRDAVNSVGDAFRKNRPQIEEVGRAIKTITPIVLELGRMFETFVINQIAGMATGFIGLAATIVKVWDGIVDTIRKGVNFVIDAINLLIEGYNKLPFHGDVDKIAHVTFGTNKKSSSDKAASSGGGQRHFGSGGVVPGPIGAPVKAVLHGGEEVLTAEERRERTPRGPLVDQIIVQGATVEGAEATATAVVRRLRAEAWSLGK